MRFCTRTLEFDYGHRVLGHTDSKGNPGKCSSLHGHRGKVEITCECESLNEIGVVIDFGRVKEIVGGWIDKNWDHTMILNSDDLLLASMGSVPLFDPKVFGPNSPYVMDHTNPTAENLAQELYKVATQLLLPHGIRVSEVVFHETPNCWATYSEAAKAPIVGNSLGTVSVPIKRFSPFDNPYTQSEVNLGTQPKEGKDRQSETKLSLSDLPNIPSK